MEIKLIGDCTILREVNFNDAAFIAGLRSDPKIYEFLSSSAPISQDSQRVWLKKYFEAKDGYYFIIENIFLSKSVGTISLYNIDYLKNEAEFGRYISLDPINALESELMLLEFCFKIINLDSVYCRTADKNVKVWKQHLSFGFRDIGFEEEKEKNMLLRRQLITKEEFEKFNYSKIKSLINRFKNR